MPIARASAIAKLLHGSNVKLYQMVRSDRSFAVTAVEGRFKVPDFNRPKDDAPPAA